MASILKLSKFGIFYLKWLYKIPVKKSMQPINFMARKDYGYVRFFYWCNGGVF
jgi:hypothetical protein